MSTARQRDAVLSSRPIEGMSAEVRATLFRFAGMYGQEADCRGGTDGFEVRSDIAVGQAFSTLAARLRSLVELLEVLAEDDLLSSRQASMVEICSVLARESCGMSAVVGEGLRSMHAPARHGGDSDATLEAAIEPTSNCAGGQA